MQDMEPVPSERQSPFRPLASVVNVPAADSAYVGRLNARSALLSQQSVRAREDVRRTHVELERLRVDMRTQLDMVKAELAIAHGETDAAVHRVERLVEELRRLARAGDGVRLQARADAWAPETWITPEQLKLMIRDRLARESL